MTITESRAAAHLPAWTALGDHAAAAKDLRLG